MLSLEMRRRRGRRKPRNLEVELKRSISEMMQIYKGFKKVWPHHKECIRTEVGNIKLSYAKSRGKKKEMIQLLDYLVKAKRFDQEKCEKRLSSLKKQQADAAKISISCQKSIIKKLIKDLRALANLFDNVREQENNISVVGNLEDCERTCVEVTGMCANKELKKRSKQKLLMRSLDEAVKEMEELISLF